MYYENFKRLCEMKGVKPNHVSVATGISTATLTNWKKGNYTPKQDKLKIIADYFGVDLEYLMSDDDEKPIYYLNPETAKKAQELFENPGMRILFDAARDASPEDLQAAADILIALKKRNG